MKKSTQLMMFYEKNIEIKKIFANKKILILRVFKNNNCDLYLLGKVCWNFKKLPLIYIKI